MTTPAKPIAAIILNWNGAKLLRQFLPEVIANTNPKLTDIFVADNGSNDDSLAILRKDFGGEVEIMAFDSNLGFAAGYNKAVAEVGDYEYCALINSDLAPDKGWDTVLYEYMEKHPGTGAAQPKILSYADPHRFEYAGACGGFLDRNGYPYCRGRIFDTCEADNGQYDTVMEVFWASGAAFMVRRRLYLDLGGLDPSFFAHMEEIDLCWRILNAGFKVAVVPQASVRHLGGGSLPMGNPRKTYLNFRNNLLMMHKNLPASERSRLLFRRRLLDTLAWLKSVLTLKWADAGAIFRAHRDYSRMSRAYTSAASENLLKSNPDILTSYYLRGIRTFSALPANMPEGSVSES